MSISYSTAGLVMYKKIHVGSIPLVTTKEIFTPSNARPLGINIAWPYLQSLYSQNN